MISGNSCVSMGAVETVGRTVLHGQAGVATRPIEKKVNLK
jgi:hypothetical protein